MSWYSIWISSILKGRTVLGLISFSWKAYHSGGGQKLCTSRHVIPAADNIFATFTTLSSKAEAKPPPHPPPRRSRGSAPGGGGRLPGKVEYPARAPKFFKSQIVWVRGFKKDPPFALPPPRPLFLHPHLRKDNPASTQFLPSPCDMLQRKSRTSFCFRRHSSVPRDSHRDGYYESLKVPIQTKIHTKIQTYFSELMCALLSEIMSETALQT